MAVVTCCVGAFCSGSPECSAVAFTWRLRESGSKSYESFRVGGRNELGWEIKISVALLGS